IAIDQQSRIVLANDDGVERRSHEGTHRPDAHIPGDVAAAFGLGEAELLEPLRQIPTRVIRDDEEWRRAGRVLPPERRRLPATSMGLIHLRPLAVQLIVFEAAAEVLGAKN